MFGEGFGDFGQAEYAPIAGSAAGLGMAAAQGNIAGVAKASLGVIQSGLKALQIAIPLWGALAGVAAGFLLSFMFQGATEKKTRTLQGTIEFQATTIRLLENGTSLYKGLDVDYLARLEQLTRPDELKIQWADPGSIIWNDQQWQTMAFYIPIAECIAVKTCMSLGITDFNSWVNSVHAGNPGSAEQTIMIKAADYLTSKGLPYPYPWDMGRLIKSGHPGFTMFDYLGYIRVKSQIGDIQPSTKTQLIPQGGDTMFSATGYPNGTLIRPGFLPQPGGGDEVDVVWNGQRRPIDSYDIFVALGFSMNNVVAVDQATWNSIPRGADISDAATFKKEMTTTQQAGFLPDLGSIYGIPISYLLIGGLALGFAIKRRK